MTTALSLFARPACADSPALQAAVTRARELRLAETTTWRRQLFYRRDPLGRWVSHAAGSDFFFALHGKESPQAELEATLAAFFLPVTSGAEDQHALCQFPGRFRWLDAQLQLTASLSQPPLHCPALDRYVTSLDAKSASFVYASNLLDNPVSALGHAFLRIEKWHYGSNETSEAGDHGIDYSAAAEATKNPLVYVFKGLTGQFRGQFRFRSYEGMIRDYAGYEDRDLWQYDLALTEPEMEMLVFHLWELTRGHLDYYYLTENCAYQVLAVLDAAAPRLDLADQIETAVLPLDAVKVVQGTPGLVSGIIYRPSVQSLSHDAMDQLDPKDHPLVGRLVKNPDTALPAALAPERAARILDAAALAVDARWSKGMMDGKNTRATTTRARLLARRAAITGVPQTPSMKEAPRDKEPHKSHSSMRALLGTGLRGPSQSGFATLGYRLVLHDLADPPDGQPELLQLQFLDTRARYDYGRRKLFLDSITFTELMAVRPLTRFDKKLSWRVRAFGNTLRDRGAMGVFAHGLDGAVGATLATEDESLAVFVMADAYAVFSTALDGVRGSAFRVGVGPYAGVRARLPGDTVGLVTGSVSYLPWQSLETTFDLRAVLRTRLGKNVAMGFEGAVQPRSLEGQLASYLYF